MAEKEYLYTEDEVRKIAIPEVEDGYYKNRAVAYQKRKEAEVAAE